MSETKIFRQAVLDRLASPEQLHTLMRVTDAKGWIALSGCGALLLTALVWGIFGSVPTKVGASGILIHEGGLADVVAVASGQVTSLEVDAGDILREGQVVAKLAQPELVEEIEGTEARLAELEANLQKAKAQGSKDVALRSAAAGQQRLNLRSAIEANQQRAQELNERLQSQQRLYEKGLVTKDTLQATRAQLRNTRSTIQSMRADMSEVSVGRFSAERANEATLEAQQMRVKETERQLELLREKLQQSAQVVSNHTGRVVEVRAMVGDVLQPGMPIVSLERTGEKGGLEALLYVDSRRGKLIQPGMTVQISPTVVRRERHGVLLGRVESVEDFPSTRRGMMRVLHNEQLVETFLRETNGAPIAVRARLVESEDTPSGYRWSSGEGPELLLTSGTRCNADVTVRTQRPISLVFPILDMGG